MQNCDLNEYIKHYYENDKSNSAIMLTGSWGSGKSYYIQHCLVPFLNIEGQNRCIIVSLYGLKSLAEISKSIYLEARIRILQSKGEAFTAGRHVAKTIAKGVTSFFGIDLSSTEEEMQSLYQSIDLSNKLIILEDIERSSIDILEVLGYVNNLVEQDNVKVLLVANEDAILKYEDSKPDKDKKVYKIPTAKTIEYLETKEKTVSDTIIFEGNYFDAIRAIIHRFSNDRLSEFESAFCVKEICELLAFRGCDNLRTFTYACQKTSDIFRKLPEDCDKANLKCIFYSIITFSTTIKTGNFPGWKGSEYLSTELSSEVFPLYRFCYDYIRWQYFDSSKVKLAFEEHKKLILYGRNSGRNDSDLVIVESYYLYPEKTVYDALQRIESRLEDKEDIPFYNYGRLVVSLIKLNTILEFDYAICKQRMIENIRGKSRELHGKLLFLSDFNSDIKCEIEQYVAFKKDLLSALDDESDATHGFSYIPEDISEYHKTVVKEEGKISASHEFLGRFDSDRLVGMILGCTSEQIDDFRGILWAVYRYAHKGSYLESDVDTMRNLVISLENKKEEGSLPADRIIRLQIDMLIGNLRGFIEQLS